MEMIFQIIIDCLKLGFQKYFLSHNKEMPWNDVSFLGSSEKSFSLVSLRKEIPLVPRLPFCDGKWHEYRHGPTFFRPLTTLKMHVWLQFASALLDCSSVAWRKVAGLQPRCLPEGTYKVAENFLAGQHVKQGKSSLVFTGN